jgi:hypothetical protein
MLIGKDHQACKKRKRKNRENMKNGDHNKKRRKRKRAEMTILIGNEVLAEKEKNEGKDIKEVINSRKLEGNTTEKVKNLTERKISTEDHNQTGKVIKVEVEQRRGISKDISKEREIHNHSHQYDIKMSTE